jgi:hypothetical protein
MARPTPAGVGLLHRHATISAAVHHDTSRPLRDLKPVQGVHHIMPPRLARPGLVARKGAGAGTMAPHPNTLVTGLMPPPIQNFDGLGQGFNGPQGASPGYGYPPDPNSAVGLADIVEVENGGLAVFSKTGTVLYGWVDVTTLWSGFGGTCETGPVSDPVVKYDHLADRWLITQLALGPSSNGTQPGYECLALSQTSDPTGAYNRYAFQYAGFPDYQKTAVWPDAQYAGFDVIGTNIPFTPLSAPTTARPCWWARWRPSSVSATPITTTPRPVCTMAWPQSRPTWTARNCPRRGRRPTLSRRTHLTHRRSQG